MPVRRLARSCALTLVTLGATATTPAVAMTESLVSTYDKCAVLAGTHLPGGPATLTVESTRP